RRVEAGEGARRQPARHLRHRPRAGRARGPPPQDGRLRRRRRAPAGRVCWPGEAPRPGAARGLEPVARAPGRGPALPARQAAPGSAA
ncbi:unnamed protein product, partial [Prorocentrum cordatum]